MPSGTLCVPGGYLPAALESFILYLTAQDADNQTQFNFRFQFISGNATFAFNMYVYRLMFVAVEIENKTQSPQDFRHRLR